MRKFLALVLALVMTMSLVTVSAGAATSFTDDAKITNAEAVEVLNAIGILGGYPDGSFRPEATLTRGAGAKLIAYLMLGQEAADNLKATYTVFEDVDDTVVLAPYIEWAAANGVVGGYGDGNFGPYNTLTEYAFGKMLLGALGFDAEEQGYVGAGWQKAVYRDAIAKGIYDGTEAFGACTRDTAARMTFETLKTTYVVYGQANVDGAFNINGVWYNGFANNVTVDGVHSTDLPVWATYEGLIYNETANDKWGVPGERWIYEGEEIAFYADEAVATYTTQVDYCDLLVDLGVSVNSNADVDLIMVYNGHDTYEFNTDCYAATGWEDTFDYVIGSWELDSIDGVDDDNDGILTDMVRVFANPVNVEHQRSHYSCDDHFVGGQGVLTRVYALGGNDYLVTEIATYLAEASAPVQLHNNVFTTAFTFDYRNLTGFGEATNQVGTAGIRDLHTSVAWQDGSAAAGYQSTVLTAETNAYAAGDYALLTLEYVGAWNSRLNVVEDVELTIEAHQAATGTVAALSQFMSDTAMSPAVGTTNNTPDAFGFALGYDAVKNRVNLGTTFVFYHDTYGNVIGATRTLAQYAVLDSIWSDHAAGVNTVTANLIDINGAAIAGANVALFNGSTAANVNTYSNNVDAGIPVLGNTNVLEIARQNALNAFGAGTGHTRHLYLISETAGNYSLDARNGNNVVYNTYADIDHSATTNADDLAYAGGTLELTATTRFILRDVNGTYTAVTRFQNLPTLSAAYADVVLVPGTTTAAVVYLDSVMFADHIAFGYVVDSVAKANGEIIDGVSYYVYDMYVAGVKRQVLVTAANDSINGNGIYQVQYNSVDGKLAVDTIVPLTARHLLAEDRYSVLNVTALNVAGQKITLDGGVGNVRLDLATFYNVDVTAHGTIVTAGSVADLAAVFAADADGRLPVEVVFDALGNIAEIYVTRNV